MKTKTIVILIAMLSMLMTCSAETGTLRIDEIVDGNAINVTVDYDATVCDYGCITKYYGNKYHIEGTMAVDDKIYNVDFNASGVIYMFEDGKMVQIILHANGKIYQDSEVGFLYEEDSKDYYGYIENGYNTGGDIYFCRNDGPYQGGDILFLTGFDLDGYSKYVITHEEANVSPPILGIGNGNNAMGDIIPTQFVYKDPDSGERVVSETYPTDHAGPVITMPARIRGEPLFPKDFWTTPRGEGMLERKEHSK